MPDEDEVTPEEPTEEELPKNNITIAQEVLAGHWGRGRARTQRLSDAGYNIQRVNEAIDKVLHQ